MQVFLFGYLCSSFIYFSSMQKSRRMHKWRLISSEWSHRRSIRCEVAGVKILSSHLFFASCYTSVTTSSTLTLLITKAFHFNMPLSSYDFTRCLIPLHLLYATNKKTFSHNEIQGFCFSFHTYEYKYLRASFIDFFSFLRQL